MLLIVIKVQALFRCTFSRCQESRGWEIVSFGVPVVGGDRTSRIKKGHIPVPVGMPLRGGGCNS